MAKCHVYHPVRSMPHLTAENAYWYNMTDIQHRAQSITEEIKGLYTICSDCVNVQQRLLDQLLLPSSYRPGLHPHSLYLRRGTLHLPNVVPCAGLVSTNVSG